jgi:hypothetical protein
MVVRRQRQNQPVDRRVGEHLLEGEGAGGKFPGLVAGAVVVAVADGGERAETRERADVVAAPIAAADDADGGNGAFGHFKSPKESVTAEE